MEELHRETQPIQRPPTQNYSAPQPKTHPDPWMLALHTPQRPAGGHSRRIVCVQHDINPVNLLHVSSNSSRLDAHPSYMLCGCASRYGLATLNKILVISEYFFFFLMYFRTCLEGRLRIKVTLRSRLCLKRSRDKPGALPPPRASHLMQ